MAEILEKSVVQPYQAFYSSSSNLANFIHGKDCIKDFSCFISCENGAKLHQQASSLDTGCDWMSYFSQTKDRQIPEMEKIYVTSEASQVELVTNPLLWECLQVIKTDSNFRDLSYRASLDLNNEEVLVVYREKVTRVFAVPVEPISLTVEPNGKCLLSIPFKPALRVSVAHQSTGELDRKALVALLQMVSGKGYSFCPGLPIKLLMGKACGKYIIVHHIPFKRYNAQGCPVYFKSQVAKTAHPKSNLRALCPRCLQISRWVQTLPFIRALNPPLALRQSPSTMKTPLSDATKQQNARSLAAVDSTSNDCMIVGVEKAETKTLMSGSSSSQRMTPTSPAIAAGSSSEAPHTSFVSETFSRRSSTDTKPNYVNVKLQSVSESLRQLIHSRNKNRQTNSAIGEDNVKIPEDGTKESKGKNVCKLCQKQFSSNLRLSKHVQRHEGSTRTVRPFQGRKTANTKFSDAVLKRWLRGSRFRTKNGKKGQGDISQTSLRMILKWLDNVVEGRVTEQSSDKSEMRKSRKRKRESIEESLSTQEGKMCKVTALDKRNLDSQDSEKSDVGFSALLVAAGIASGQSHPTPTSPGSLHTSSSPVSSNLHQDLINIDPSTREEDSLGEARKARKSPRLASKRAKATTKKTPTRKDKSGEEDSLQHQHTDDSLTNLDLLSTVSVQAAAVAVLKPMINNSIVGSSATSRPSLTSTLPFPTSPSGLNASSLPPRQNFSTNAARPLPPELVRVTPGNKSSNLPALPALTYVPQEEQQRFMYPTSKIPVSSFSPRSTPVISSPTEKVALGHNIPIHLLEKDVSLSSSSMGTETSHILGSQPQTSSESDCGAMDLSKRKTPSCKVLGMTSQGNPSPGPDSSKNAADVIRRLLMINPQEPAMTPVNLDPPSPRALASNKEADENLQARIFASAKDYKVDNLKQSVGQVQTVVAPFSGPPSNFKPGKPLSTEIQCGYKWSGSGGLVKERTQMVKELVPSMVISDILSKPSGAPSQRDNSISATVTGVAKVKSPFGSSFSRLYEATEPAATSTLSTKTAESPGEPSAQNSTASCALNLSKSRPESGTHGRLTVLPSTLLSLSSVVSTTSAAGKSLRSLKGHTAVVSSPSSPHSNVFRNSFRHPSGLAEQSPTSLSQSSKDGNSGSSTRILSLPIPVMPVSPISSASSSSSPAPQSISSPSLAAILRQPPNPRLNQNSSGNGNTQAVSAPSNSLDAGPYAQDKIQIKHEPVDPELDASEAKFRNFSRIVVKTESLGAPSNAYSTHYGIDKRNSPGNVVVDMSSERLSVSSVESDSNLSTSPFSSLKVRPTTRGLAKCEFCSQLFSSPTDSSNHVCPGGFKS